MIVPARPLDEVTQRVIQMLSREIGVADTVRFLNQFVTGPGNYTAEREELFQDLSLDDILSQIHRDPTEQRASHRDTESQREKNEV